MPIPKYGHDPRIERIQKEIINNWKKHHVIIEKLRADPIHNLSKKQLMTPEDWFTIIILIILFIILFFPIWF